MGRLYWFYWFVSCVSQNQSTPGLAHWSTKLWRLGFPCSLMGQWTKDPCKEYDTSEQKYPTSLCPVTWKYWFQGLFVKSDHLNCPRVNTMPLWWHEYKVLNSLARTRNNLKGVLVYARLITINNEYHYRGQTWIRTKRTLANWTIPCNARVNMSIVQRGEVHRGAKAVN